MNSQTRRLLISIGYFINNNNIMNDSEFYSNQPWYVKLWRNKTLFFIPFDAVNTWIKETLRNDLMSLNFKQSLSIARGMADVRRKHLTRWKPYIS